MNTAKLSKVLAYADELRLDQDHAGGWEYNVTAPTQSKYVKFLGMAESISAGALTITHVDNLTISIRCLRTPGRIDRRLSVSIVSVRR